jgi:HEAT repeat protein
VVALAIQAIRDPDAGVRTEACAVLQNQCAWKVDVSQAIQPLTGLLGDPAWRVRHQAAYACGNFAGQKQYDLIVMVSPLTLNLAHENIYVRVASAWALWKLAKRHDLSAAVPELARILASDDDYDAARKNAAGALLCWAKRAPAHLSEVRGAVSELIVDVKRKEVARFVRELAAV